MPNVPSVSDQPLAVVVLVAMIAVQTVAATLGSPAAAATVGIASQDERFQPQEMRPQPPFGARTVLKPVEFPQPQRLWDAKAAR